MGAEVAKLLFPDTPHGKESGGRPEAIPTLQRETFLDFYRNHLTKIFSPGLIVHIRITALMTSSLWFRL